MTFFVYKKLAVFPFLSGRLFEAILSLKKNVGNLRNIYAGDESLAFRFSVTLLDMCFHIFSYPWNPEKHDIDLSKPPMLKDSMQLFHLLRNSSLDRSPSMISTEIRCMESKNGIFSGKLCFLR